MRPGTDVGAFDTASTRRAQGETRYGKERPWSEAFDCNDDAGVTDGGTGSGTGAGTGAASAAVCRFFARPGSKQPAPESHGKNKLKAVNTRPHRDHYQTAARISLFTGR